jgi:glycerol uptake facilitator-like aquaporin
MPRKLLAEFVGTFALIFIGAGSIVASGNEISGITPGAGLVTIALAHGLAIATMVTAVGHVSGGHFNPAVSVAAWVTRCLGTGEFIAYVITQLLGGSPGPRSCAWRCLRTPGSQRDWERPWWPGTCPTPRPSPSRPC